MDITLSEDIDAEYLEDVADILTNKEFLALNSYRHHVATTRLMHSINVSYISWLTAKKLGCDTQEPPGRGCFMISFCMTPERAGPPGSCRPSAIPRWLPGPAGKPLKFPKKKGTPYCPICSRWDPFPNPGKHGLYPARTKYAPVRKYSILRLHWQETDAWQSARRKDEGFLSNCIKRAGEDAFQGAVSLTAVQRTGRVYPAPILCFFVLL